jgi:two-component system copper resistance phosphate regulon response regulator CusR
MRLLLIEDEPKLAASLCQGLSEAGYRVDVVHNGLDGKRMAIAGQYDLVVLDVMLPRLDGFGVLSALRRKKATPVLMLTARDAVKDRVRGLHGGADDYLVKPFAFSELLARVHALLRRGHGGQLSGAVRKPALAVTLEPSRRQAFRDGQAIDLTAQEFALLALLLERHGQVLSRQELSQQLWNVTVDNETNVIDVAIRRLRVKLDEPFEDKLLHTVRGLGYVLERRSP